MGIRGSNRDITDLKRKEEALHRQKEMLQTILDNIPIMVEFLNREGRHQSVNRRWQSTLGWSLKEAQHKNVFEEIYPDPEYRKYVQDYVAAAEGTWGDFKARTRDGRVLDTSWMNLPLLDGSSIGIGIDITERKRAEGALRESEDRYRLLFENSLNGILLLAPNGDFIEANPAACRIFGRTEEEICCTTIDDLVDPNDVRLASFLEKRVRDGKATGELMLARKDGTLFSADVSSVVLKATDGIQITNMIIRDVTERKQAEEEYARHRKDLLKLTHKLVHAQETERKEISRELHDEIGQSLTAIKINLSKIYNAIPSERDPVILERMAETEAMADCITEQIREMSLNLRPPMLDDLGLIPTLGWYVKKFAKRVGVDVTIDAKNLPKRIPSVLETNLFRIVQEALTNVAKHAHAKKVAIRLNLKESALQLAITDDGCGFNVKKPHDKQSEVPGMGLIGMRERVAFFNGRLDIEPNPESGTSLLISIPWKEGKNG